MDLEAACAAAHWSGRQPPNAGWAARDGSDFKRVSTVDRSSCSRAAKRLREGEVLGEAHQVMNWRM